MIKYVTIALFLGLIQFTHVEGRATQDHKGNKSLQTVLDDSQNEGSLTYGVANANGDNITQYFDKDQSNFEADFENYNWRQQQLQTLVQSFQQSVFESLSQEELSRLKRFYIIPIGLPGMGKTTLSSALLKINNYTLEQQPMSQDKQTNKNNITMDFIKIDYDQNLTNRANQYCIEHPEIDFHTAIDIVRADADKWFLETIMATNTQEQDRHLQNDDDASHFVKKLFFLDRNNTPEHWQNIQSIIDKAHESNSVKDYKTILVVPRQHKDFQPQLYNAPNPIGPQMIYECSKRIFKRKQHSCLSNENKDKVIDVILKFTRLYDGVDLQDDRYLQQYFDQVVRLDFLHLEQRGTLEPQTIETLIECYNETPNGFRSPNSQTIKKCMRAIELQIGIDEQRDRRGQHFDKQVFYQ